MRREEKRKKKRYTLLCAEANARAQPRQTDRQTASLQPTAGEERKKKKKKDEKTLKGRLSSKPQEFSK